MAENVDSIVILGYAHDFGWTYIKGIDVCFDILLFYRRFLFLTFGISVPPIIMSGKLCRRTVGWNIP